MLNSNCGSKAHSLDTIAGYLVVQTIKDGKLIPDGGLSRNRLMGSHRYPEALELAKRYRNLPTSYAVVCNVYRCGCTGQGN